MGYQIRLAQMNDLKTIETIYCSARIFMENTGNPTQWGKTYPSREQICKDIREEKLYVMTQNAMLHGVFYFYIGVDPTYNTIVDGHWHAGTSYGTIHRIAGDGSGGILKAAVEYCCGIIDYIRIDTHENNAVMQRALQKHGFQKCGIIFTDDGTARIAYDRLNR